MLDKRRSHDNGGIQHVGYDDLRCMFYHCHYLRNIDVSCEGEAGRWGQLHQYVPLHIRPLYSGMLLLWQCLLAPLCLVRFLPSHLREFSRVSNVFDDTTHVIQNFRLNLQSFLKDRCTKVSVKKVSKRYPKTRVWQILTRGNGR